MNSNHLVVSLRRDLQVAKLSIALLIVNVRRHLVFRMTPRGSFL